MVRLTGVVLAASLVHCARGATPGPATPAPVVRAEPPAEPAPATAQLRMAPTDTPPVFVDPERRAKLESTFPAIDTYLQGTVARDRLVGLAAGIVIDGELVWFRGYGQRDPARGLPIERDTVFGIGSITKTIAALAVLKLRDEGRLDLDRPAADYLPALDAIAYPTADSPRITIRHILTHRSGLPRMGNFPEYPETPPSRAEFLATLDGLGLDRPPGERRVYSNLAFQLLGPLIEEVAGVDHRTYTRKEILDPLGMHATVWHPEDVPGDRIAVGHERRPGQDPRPRPHWRPGAADAAGGLYSSVEDLARYAAYNLAAWPARDEPEAGPLRRATLREAHGFSVLVSFGAESVPDAPARAQVSGGGLGFGVVANCRFEHIVVHNGKTLNYRASLHMLPQHGVAVILLSNLSSIHSSVLPNDGTKIVEILADSGGLEPRKHSPSSALLTAAAGFGAFIGGWDDGVYARLFSADFRDANPTEVVKGQFADWRALVGACRDPRAITLEDPRAGTVELACDRGGLRVELRVAPWAGAPITSLSGLGATGLPASPELTRAAERSLQLMRRWNEREFGEVFGPKFDAGEMRKNFAAAADAWGRCRLGEARLTGTREATFALNCERGAPVWKLKLGTDTPAKIVGADIREDRSGPCR